MGRSFATACASALSEFLEVMLDFLLPDDTEPRLRPHPLMRTFQQVTGPTSAAPEQQPPCTLPLSQAPAGPRAMPLLPAAGKVC